MILTDDNYATIVKAVGLGRAVYDNLLRFIRFQMAGLFGFIATFLGLVAPQHPGRDPVPAAADDVAQLHRERLPGDRPRLRQAAGGPHEGPAAAEGAADHPPPLMTWLVFMGLVMAAGTLAVLSWPLD